MTKKEIIKTLEDIKFIFTYTTLSTPRDTKKMIALDLAIKELEKETCEDAISRQAVINHICEGKECYKDDCKGRIYKRCFDLQWIYDLPPVTPYKTEREVNKNE